jgi:hypothetical protein
MFEQLGMYYQIKKRNNESWNFLSYRHQRCDDRNNQLARFQQCAAIVNRLLGYGFTF